MDRRHIDDKPVKALLLNLLSEIHVLFPFMKKPAFQERIVILGMGSIGTRLLHHLSLQHPTCKLAAFGRHLTVAAESGLEGIARFHDIESLEAWKPTLAVECAGHSAVIELVPRLLQRGVNVILASLGALAGDAVRTRLTEASRSGGGQLILVSGAIGGLDALRAASFAGIDKVVYTGSKPPIAWQGTPAEKAFQLSSLTQASLIFQGTAAQSAVAYPKNANVTAAVALAGIGFEKTEVRLYADPGIEQNVHELDVHGSFGRFTIRLVNNPLPGNPKTSWLAALSIEAEIARYLSR